MPVYEFKCNVCGELLEVEKSIKDSEKPKHCEEEMEKLISKTSFRLMGSRWARDGYK